MTESFLECVQNQIYYNSPKSRHLKVLDFENIRFLRRVIVATILDSFCGIGMQCHKRGVTKKRQNKTWDLTSRTFRSNDADPTNRKQIVN